MIDVRFSHNLCPAGRAAKTATSLMLSVWGQVYKFWTGTVGMYPMSSREGSKATLATMLIYMDKSTPKLPSSSAKVLKEDDTPDFTLAIRVSYI